MSMGACVVCVCICMWCMSMGACVVCVYVHVVHEYGCMCCVCVCACDA